MWQCPTLTVNQVFGYLDSNFIFTEDRLKYIPYEKRKYWSSARRFYDPEYPKNKKANFELLISLLPGMLEKGIPFLAGTDYTNPFCFPGFSLHDELQLMVDAGFTPFQALKTATWNPAVFMGKQEDFGSVETGKIANLVLLNSNPLDNIANTKKIERVFFHGNHYSRTFLDSIMLIIEQELEKPPLKDTLGTLIDEIGIQKSIKLLPDWIRQHKLRNDRYQLLRLAEELLYFNRTEEAIIIAEQQINNYPDDYEAYLVIAKAYKLQGKRSVATEYNNAALRLNPFSTKAKEGSIRLSE